MFKKYHTIFSLIIIWAIGFIIYSNSFRGDFQFDDYTTIVSNPYIKNIYRSHELFTYSPLRFISNFTFTINYYLGKNNVFGYHLVNFSIHAVNAALIFILIRLLIQTPFIVRENKLFLLVVALICSLLFISHPIQTQAVNYISQRSILLAAMFYLLVLILLTKAHLDQIYTRKRSIFYLLAILAFPIALLTKEIIFTLPVAILMINIFFFTKKVRISYNNIAIFLPFALISGLIVFLLHQSLFDTPIPRLHYFLTQIGVLKTYIRLLVLPFNLHLDYNYPITTSFFNLHTIFSLLFLLLIISGGFFMFNKNRFISFGIFLFFLTLTIESSFIPLNDVIFEHRLYLPSVSFFMVIAGILQIITNKIHRNSTISVKLLWSIIVIILVIYTRITYQRNNIWNSDYTLWLDSALKSPYKARPHDGLGVAYLKKNKLKEAADQFQIAVFLDNDYFRAYNNLGVLYEYDGKLEVAEAFYRKSIEKAIHNSASTRNLENLQDRLKILQ